MALEIRKQDAADITASPEIEQQSDRGITLRAVVIGFLAIYLVFVTTIGRLRAEVIANPTQADVPDLIAMVFGAGVVFLLSFLRAKFVWFPFHPAGYVLANTGTMKWLWCPFLIAWLCKVIITKYAGIKGYRAALPFFLGLVLGDYVTSGLWALAGSVLGIRMYRCFPC